MNPPMTFYPLQRVSKGGRPITPAEARAMMAEIRNMFADAFPDQWVVSHDAPARIKEAAR